MTKYLPRGNSTMNYHVLPTRISDTTSHALGQEQLNDGKLGELCGRHSDAVGENLRKKSKKKAQKNENCCVQKILILIYAVFCFSENFSTDGSLWKVSCFLCPPPSLTSVKLEIYSKLQKFIFVSVIFTDFLLGNKLITCVYDSETVQVSVL